MAEMTELEKVERDIATLREANKLARQSIADHSLTSEQRAAERAGIADNDAELAQLLRRRDELRGVMDN